MRGFLCGMLLVGCALADEPRKEQPVAKLWAGLGVTSPVVRADDVVDANFFMVSFALVNDGDAAIDPEVLASKFLVNGKELKDWAFIIGNGPRGKDFEALPAGEPLRFGYALGRHFTEPGIYKIQWKGKAFESPVVEFRVLPARPR